MLWCCAGGKKSRGEETEIDDTPTERPTKNQPHLNQGELSFLCADLKFGRVDAGDVARLLDARADPNAVDHCSNCALMYTAKVESKELEEQFVDSTILLLERKAQADVTGWCDSTPLHSAAQCGHTKTLELLIHAKASLERQDSNQQRALHMAAVCGYLGIVDLLLGNGADVNAVNKDGFTALQVAASSGRPDVVELLLERGAAVDAKSKTGTTAQLRMSYEALRAA